MVKVEYKTPSLSISEQIQLLKEKGLSITPENNVERWLSHVSYFRLKHYTNKFKDPKTGNFIPNSSFRQVIRLYLFDRELKFILFDAIETIEIAIKTLLSNSMARSHGTHWYMERMHFSHSFNFDDFLTFVRKEVADADEPSIKQYKRFYDEPELPPCWMIIELLSFGTMSKMFEHLSARDIKLEICWKYQLPDNILTNWLHCITQLRNRCAHHSRIVYRSMSKTIALPSRARHKFLDEVNDIDLSSLYATLCCLQNLIDKIQPESNFKLKLINLIEKNTEINYGYMGFTKNWRRERIWQL